MADEPLVDRLKVLQEQLLRLYAETVSLREQAVRDAKSRRLNEWPALNGVKPSGFESDHDPSAS